MSASSARGNGFLTAEHAWYGSGMSVKELTES